MASPEQRRSERVYFSSRAVVRYGEDLLLETSVDTRNISLHGIFLETGVYLPLEAPCEIEVFLGGASSQMSFRVQGMVQRREPSGMAIAFTAMEKDSAIHILSLVKLHTDEGDGVISSLLA